MTIAPKSIQQLTDMIVAQLEAAFNQTIPLLPKAFNRVVAKVLAAVFVTLYHYGGSIFLNMFIATASNEETEINGRLVRPLTEYGRQNGTGDPVAATQAELQTDVTVNVQVGFLLSGEQLLNSASGIVYLVVGDVALSAPTVTATVRASSDQSGGNGAGAIGNMDVGETLSFVKPVPNVERDTVISGSTVTGANAEDTEVYRQRVLDREQKVPQGGAYADYELWSEEVAGIINSYVYTGDPGQVNVYSEATVASSGSPDGIPTNAQLQAVLDSIEANSAGLATRRPANAYANSLPISRTAFDVTVSGLDVVDPATVEANIETAVAEYFAEAEPFIPGLSVLPRKDRITSSSVTAVVEDVVTAAGGLFASVLTEVSGSTFDLYSLGEGEKAKSNAVVFS